MLRLNAALWDRYCDYLYSATDLGIVMDVSRVRFNDHQLAAMEGATTQAFRAMAALEAGGIANRDESRMVGHYWLRAPDLSPTKAISREISAAQEAVRSFAGQVHNGAIRGTVGPFRNVLHVGIGGSAVGPQLLHEARRGSSDKLAVHFLDNSDPDGVDRVLERLDGGPERTLVSVVSKSGVTPTPFHVMLEMENTYRRSGLDFARHAVATTVAGSPLYARAADQGWLARFPLWDWVGGRTSLTSAVGLLPAALQGIDIDALLRGAATMDRLTRIPEVRKNPAALLASMWYHVGNGRGEKNMVILPYSDRLSGVPRWIQQLVMESIGKRFDRAGRIVQQGLTVYGNKGSTDQHAYLQQLRDGTPDFFVTFVRVHQERVGEPVELLHDTTLGDHLFGGLEGTRNALYARGRDSITISLTDTSEASLGAFIALYERAVGLYAELIDVNAYDQPGVDKYAAGPVLAIQRAALGQLRTAHAPQTAEQVAAAIGEPEQVETVYKILEHLASSGQRCAHAEGATPHDIRFAFVAPSGRP